MVPPKLSKKMKRSVVLRIKLRPGESYVLRQAARAEGVSMAQWARQRFLTALLKWAGR